MKLLYLAYTYGHLFKIICYDVGLSIQVILYSPILGLRGIWSIMQKLALAFSALPLDFLSCTCGLGEIIEIIEIMMSLSSMWRHTYIKAYFTIVYDMHL